MENTYRMERFLKSGGDTGRLISQLDWTLSPIGTVSGWPQSLRTALTLLLNAKVPMALLWGQDNTCFYNDAYARMVTTPIADMIGRPASSIWEKDWPTIEPLLEKLKTDGGPVHDQSSTCTIRTGAGGSALLSADFVPIFNETEEVDGIAVTFFENNIKNPQDLSIQNDSQFQLNQSEIHLQLLRDTVPAMIFYLDRGQRYQSYNKVFSDWFGVPSPDAIGKTVREFLGEAAYESVCPHLDIAYSGTPERYELFAPSRMGVPRWLDIVYTPHKDDEGEVQGLIVHATDITKSKLTEISLRESEARFKDLIEHAPVATCLFSGKEMTIELANEIMLTMWGKDRSVIGKTLESGVPELVGQPFLDILDRVYATGVPYSETAAAANLEVNGVLSTYYYNFTYKPLFNEYGEVYGIMDMAIDVTEQVMIRKRIEESERKLRTLIQSAPPAIGMFVGRELIIESPNQAFKDTIGRGDDIEGKSLKSLMPELEQQPFLALLENVFTTGELFHTDSAKLQVLRGGKLEDKYFNITFSPLFDETGNVYAIIDVSVDVTDTVLAKQKVEAKEKELRDLIIAAPVGICVVSGPSTQVVEVNQRFLEITGTYKSKEPGSGNVILSGDLLTVFEKEVGNVINSGLKHATEEQKMEVLRNGRQEIIFINFEYVPLLDAANMVNKVMIIAIEVTQQVQQRQEIEKAVNLRTKELADLNINLQRSNNELEQFAYIASHDLQEPVRKINTFIGMLESSLDGLNGKSKSYFDKIKGATLRMEALIRDVLAFSIASQNEGRVADVDLQAILREVENENELQITAKQAVLDYSDLPTLKAIPSQMIQLFSNLISNSLKYTAEGKRPIVKISASRLKSDEYKMYSQLVPYVKYDKIEVADNGIGFDQQHAERIFKIFQRLHGKNEFEGTGIGLSICQKIVHNHSGDIKAFPGINGGALFVIVLPV